MTSDHLFVYGTLMRGFDHPMGGYCRATRSFSAKHAAGAGSIG